MSCPPEIVAIIQKLNRQITPDLIAIRRWMHENPELGFEEIETSGMIQHELDKAGVSWQGGFGKTGVCATIDGGKGPCIALRADFDALPFQETGNPAYKSKIPGKMHACGHDAHTAIILGVVRILSQIDLLPGKAMFIFQPAEEVLGGARAMLEDGLFRYCDPDVVLGYHNWPPLPAGTIGWHPTTAFASSDPFDIVVKGKSGHGAHPHFAKDPIVAAGALVAGLQNIVSREVAPLNAAVVTVGSIHGGTARNQIPDIVTLEGAVRTQSEDVRQLVKQAIFRISEGIAQQFDMEIEVKFLQGVPPVVNTPEVLAKVVETARHSLGSENVIELPQGTMGSEDFAEYSNLKPSAHLRIGSQHKALNTMLHRSDFDLDENCIPTAVQVLCEAMISLMLEESHAASVA
ncbi:M20 metallopeptidase family protein [Cohaesibacter celericrescens]|uniref:Amidohydrolase n=1 Tax=Cohaesibacter celericrescens TaxID=2067669 RepID=A0A2N5XNL9_9HYPH|nr:M20 family metallopeptidase [Cohaesibacter celericrescens]PLW76092.1 amidohydrolase [Cohaesibacter celericrescens]